MIHFSVSLVNCYFIKYNRLAQRPRKKGAIGWFAGRSAKLLAAKWVAVAKCCKPVRNETIETDSGANMTETDETWHLVHSISTPSLLRPCRLQIQIHFHFHIQASPGLAKTGWMMQSFRRYQEASSDFFGLFWTGIHNSVLKYNTGLLRVLCLSG